MTDPEKQARMFLDACKPYGFAIHTNDHVVRIVRHFRPGDLDAFASLDCVAGGVLSLAPLRGGSVWGTDGGSVGGAVAVRNGRFEMSKSGTGIRFIRALRSLTAREAFETAAL